MKEVFDSSGRITAEARTRLPENLYVKADDMDGCKAFRLYKRLTEDWLEIACLIVDVEVDEVKVTFQNDGAIAQIETPGLDYIMLSSEMLRRLAALAEQAATEYERFRTGPIRAEIKAMDEATDQVTAKRLSAAFHKRHAKVLGRWIEVR
jgi:hypothetical protein